MSTSAKEIFLDAVEQPESRRLSFIERACADDASVLARVRALLDSHGRDNDMLDRGLPTTSPIKPLVDSADAAKELIAGTGYVDGYRLIRLLGHGGFGVVWLAEQLQPLRRLVALKLLRPELSGQSAGESTVRELIARFETERQALAMMDHPNIAKVFDAGTVRDGSLRGRPYFVMEYVQGVPINRYCAVNRLGTRERIELMIGVSTGVQHAHQRGIIHRDIKPGNLLVADVDGKPVPKVIDFGVAKAVGAPLSGAAHVTQHMHVIGTPQYMSPEQAVPGGGGLVDTRSDVYALGAVLYELLTGVPPIDPAELEGKPLDEVCRVIRHGTVARPSRRRTPTRSTPASSSPATDSVVRGPLKARAELDWIVMMALEKDPARRYQTAHQLAFDLQRYLSGDTLIAAPPSQLYRLRKFAARHRKMVAAALALVVVVALGLAGTTAGFVRARAQAREAARQTDVARAINEFLTDELLAAAAPSDEKGRGRDVMLVDVLDAASKRIRDASAPGGKFDGHPAVQAAVRRSIGNTYEKLGRYRQAVEHLRESHRLHSAEFGDDDLRTVDVLADLANAVQGLEDFTEAERLHRSALAGYRRLLGAADERTLLVAQRLAGTLERAGRGEEALAVFREALDALAAAGGVVNTASLNIARLVRHAVAMKAVEAGDEETARQQFLAQLEDYRRVYGRDDPQTLATQVRVGIYLSMQGPPHKAQELLSDALPRLRSINGPLHPKTVDCAWFLAEHLYNQGRRPEAQALIDTILKDAREAGDEATIRLITSEQRKLTTRPSPATSPAR
jgi:serine/threonine protein kinase